MRDLHDAGTRRRDWHWTCTAMLRSKPFPPPLNRVSGRLGSHEFAVVNRVSPYIVPVALELRKRPTILVAEAARQIAGTEAMQQFLVTCICSSDVKVFVMQEEDFVRWRRPHLSGRLRPMPAKTEVYLRNRDRIKYARL